MKLPLPSFAIPVICLWLAAVYIACFGQHRPVLGLSYHTYTGLLFLAAAVASVLWLWLVLGLAQERKQKRLAAEAEKADVFNGSGSL